MTLSATGYNKKTFDEIVTEIKSAVWASPLGVGMNLEPESVTGQLVLIFAKFLSDLYADVEDVYNSQSPSNASGIPLDNNCETVNTYRLEATKGTGTITVSGILGTIITAGTLTVSVDGNSDAQFVTTADGTIAAGTNAVQDIDFNTVPDAGNWSLTFNGVTTSTMAHNDAAATVQANLEALSNVGAGNATVTGNYTTGFTVTFTTDEGSKPQNLLTYTTNTLETSSVAVAISISETTAGVLPHVDILVEAVTAGATPAYAGTLTVIETPLSGVDSVTNAADITQGTDIETDAALRLRRIATLANPGKSTVDAIRAHLLEVTDITAARVYENDTDAVDAYSRPAGSLEAVVVGGTTQEIVDIVGADKPAGTQTYGSSSGTYTTTQGQSKTIYFSRPTSVPIYIDLTVTTDPDTFPVDGSDAIKTALADYGDANFSISDDVIFYKLYKPLEDIIGIISIVMTIGITASPVGTSNITIDDDEISNFDTANIDVTVI